MESILIQSLSVWGGGASIMFVPLRLKHALMTCPIRLPTEEELPNLDVHWLTVNAPWDPFGLSEVLDPTLPVPLGYTDTLGTMDLLDLDLEWETLAPVQADKSITQEQVADELTQALRYINFSQCTQADIFVNQVTPKEDEYQKYQPFLGWKPFGSDQAYF